MAYKYARVMLIDDGEVDNLINKKMLEAAQFAQYIFTHTSGASALEFLRNLEEMGPAAEALLPERIFLDINMPLMDGFQFLDHFDKLNARIKNYSQIIMLTASPNDEYVKTSKQYPYVLRYVVKPLSERSLKAL